MTLQITRGTDPITVDTITVTRQLTKRDRRTAFWITAGQVAPGWLLIALAWAVVIAAWWRR